MRNLFPTDLPRLGLGRSTPPIATPHRGRLALRSGDRLLEIRWELVQALRTAIAANRYDVDARLNDLLDDPPAELLAFGWW
jgi:hypothetical protein